MGTDDRPHMHPCHPISSKGFCAEFPQPGQSGDSNIQGMQTDISSNRTETPYALPAAKRRYGWQFPSGPIVQRSNQRRHGWQPGRFSKEVRYLFRNCDQTIFPGAIGHSTAVSKVLSVALSTQKVQIYARDHWTRFVR